MANPIDTFTHDNLVAGDAQDLITKEVVVDTGVLARGTVLGKITAGAVGTVTQTGTGDGTLGSVTRGRRVKAGNYKAKCILAAANGGTFQVKDPDGNVIGTATVGVAFTSPQINFTISDGAADFVAGDEFTIPVAAGSGKSVKVDSTVVDGSGVADSVLAEAVDATSADKTAIAYDAGMFNEDALVFGGSDTKETHRADLRAKSVYMKVTMDVDGNDA